MIRTSILISKKEKEYIDKQAINLSSLVRNVVDYIMEKQIPLEKLIKKMSEGENDKSNI